MKFRFPDVADFPENDAPVFPEHIDPPDFDNGFEKNFADLLYLIDKHMPGIDHKILNGQVARINVAEKMYREIKKPLQSELDPDGIAHRLEDITSLQSFFKHDIDFLLGYEPKYPLAINEVDRARTRNDEGARNVVRKFLVDCGLLQNASYHADKQLQVAGVTIHVSKPGDQHHYQQFRDCETVTKLLNLHMDPKPGVMKAMIYLNEVTKDNGPFQFIQGSHKWKVDPIERIFAWGNSVGNYCHTSEHRRVANAFPTRFRRTAIIGRLIQDGTSFSQFLLNSLTSYTSDWANVMVFNPCFNFHRGGQCRIGTRVNLQVVLK